MRPAEGADPLGASEEWLLLTEDERFLARRLVAALDFEPYPACFEGAAILLDALIARGLAESGPSLRPAVGAVGYRLTPSGWALVSANWAFAPPTGGGDAARSRIASLPAPPCACEDRRESERNAPRPELHLS